MVEVEGEMAGRFHEAAYLLASVGPSQPDLRFHCRRRCVKAAESSSDSRKMSTKGKLSCVARAGSSMGRCWVAGGGSVGG